MKMFKNLNSFNSNCEIKLLHLNINEGLNPTFSELLRYFLSLRLSLDFFASGLGERLDELLSRFRFLSEPDFLEFFFGLRVSDRDDERRRLSSGDSLSLDECLLKFICPVLKKFWRRKVTPMKQTRESKKSRIRKFLKITSQMLILNKLIIYIN